MFALWGDRVNKDPLLHEACPGQMTVAGPRDVRRIREGVLPWGRTSWPDEVQPSQGMRIVLCNNSDLNFKPNSCLNHLPDEAPTQAQRRLQAVRDRVLARLGRAGGVQDAHASSSSDLPGESIEPTCG